MLDLLAAACLLLHVDEALDRHNLPLNHCRDFFVNGVLSVRIMSPLRTRG